MKLWICTYCYQGQETEGHAHLRQHFICEAVDKVEALYKYQVWHTLREGIEPYFKTLSEYRQSECADGGWGYAAYELHSDTNNAYRYDNNSWWRGVYEKYDK